MPTEGKVVVDAKEDFEASPDTGLWPDAIAQKHWTSKRT